MTDQVITTLLEHIFQNENFPGIGDIVGLRSSVTDGYFYFALHTGNPKELSDTEVSYTGYHRVAVARSASGFTVSGNRAFNFDFVTFPEREDSGANITATYFALHTALSGEGNLFESEMLVVPAVLITGQSKSYGPGTLVTEIRVV